MGFTNKKMPFVIVKYYANKINKNAFYKQKIIFREDISNL